MPLAVPRDGGHTGGLWGASTRMRPRQIGDLLDRVGCLRHPCDLDLLLFFYRHPQAYLKSERLADYTGYDLPQVVESLETLITAGLLRQSPDSISPARLYVLTRRSTRGRWLSSLLQIAATREGRLAVFDALKQRPSSARSRAGEAEPEASARAVSRTLEEPDA
jgi:hypothetical protein